jgi:RND family efflux transporter MFP subunit
MKLPRQVVLLVCAGGLAVGLGFGRYQQPAAKGDGKAEVKTAAALADSFGGEKFITRASKDSNLSFTFPAEVSEILVHGGQRVNKGDPLLRARDEDIRYQRDHAQLVAESDLDIQKAQAGVDLAEVEFRAQQELRAKNTGSKIDYDRAEATLKARRVDVEIAKYEKRQHEVELQIRQAQLDRLTIEAPFSGIIDEVMVDPGQVKRDTDNVLRIVDTNPLWIDVPAPTGLTMTLGLKPSDKAWVLLDLPGEPKVWMAKIIEVGAAADGSSNTRRVRVELANPNDWPSGLTAWVRFTPPQGDWGARVVDPESLKKRAESAGHAPEAVAKGADGTPR